MYTFIAGILWKKAFHGHSAIWRELRWLEVIEKYGAPGGLELPTFWFVVSQGKSLQKLYLVCLASHTSRAESVPSSFDCIQRCTQYFLGVAASRRCRFHRRLLSTRLRLMPVGIGTASAVVRAAATSFVSTEQRFWNVGGTSRR